MLVIRTMNIHDVSFHQKNNSFGKAPHKVLLFLVAYQAYKQGHERLLSFEHYIQPRMHKLLSKLGNNNPRPEYPFWRLQNDGIWDVHIDKDIEENNSGDVSKKQLFDLGATGGFSNALYLSAVNKIDDYEKLVKKMILERVDASASMQEWLLDYFLNAQEYAVNSENEEKVAESKPQYSAKREKKTLSRKSTEVLEYIAMVNKVKRDAEVVTLREWYDSTTEHTPEIQEYMKQFKNLGRLGKELHKRGVERVTERFADDVRTLVEATYNRQNLDVTAPLCASALIRQQL